MTTLPVASQWTGLFTLSARRTTVVPDPTVMVVKWYTPSPSGSRTFPHRAVSVGSNRIVP